jgi:hypothetical protein
MRRSLWLLPATLMFLAGLACDEDPAGPTDSDPDPGLVGTVVDTDGVPVAGAPVGLIYGVNPGYWPEWPPDEAESEVCDAPGGFEFRFGIEEMSRITARLFDHREQEVFTFCENEQLMAGVHGFGWPRTDQDGNLVPNGAYTFRVWIERAGFSDVQEISGIYLNAFSYDYSNCVGAIAITDAEGGFRIPYAEMPLGAEVRCGYDGVTCTIPDTLWIQSAVEGFGARRLLRIEDFQADLPVILRWTQRRD